MSFEDAKFIEQDPVRWPAEFSALDIPVPGGLSYGQYGECTFLRRLYL